MTNFRMMLLSTAAVGVTSMVAMSSASAADVEKKFGWSGHVNRVIAVADDGQDQSTLHNDPVAISQSRARMKASAKSDAMEIGATVELGISANRGDNATAQTLGADIFGIRHSFIYVKNSMGRIRVGDTAHAGEGYVGTMMDGASLGGSINGTVFDGLLFNNKTVTTNVAAGVSVDTAHGNDFSPGRNSGVSYDTPTFGGFKATVSHTSYGSGSGEIQYGGDFNGVAVKAGAMYTTLSSSGTTAHTTEDITGYGAGFKLANGLSVSGNYKKRSLDGGVNTTNRADPEMYYGRVGYDMTGFSDLGSTSVAFGIRDVSDRAATGDQYDEYSVMFVQNLSDYGTSVYGGFTQMELDTTAANFDDIAGAFVGMRVVF